MQHISLWVSKQPYGMAEKSSEAELLGMLMLAPMLTSSGNISSLVNYCLVAELPG